MKNKTSAIVRAAGLGQSFENPKGPAARSAVCRIVAVLSTVVAVASILPSAVSAQNLCGVEMGAAMEDGWAAYRSGDMPEAETSFERAEALCPSSNDAQVGLSYVELRSGEWASARVRLEAVFRADSTRGDVRSALARLEGWEGNLRASEDHWRAALEAHPDDPEIRAGLARVLRWQGRTTAAIATLEAAGEGTGAEGVLQDEWEVIRRNGRPAAGVAVTVESDSDGNRMWTGTARTDWRPMLHVAVRLDSYLRRTDLRGIRARRALGHALTTILSVDPGWTLSTTLGGSETSVSSIGVRRNVRVGITSPRRNRVQGTAYFANLPLDYTSPMIERGVTSREIGFEASSDLFTHWSSTVSASIGQYEGAFENGRWEGRAAIERTWSEEYTAGLSVRHFGFEEDVLDGYYDPTSFLLLEAPILWNWELVGASVALSFAPGLQRAETGTLFEDVAPATAGFDPSVRMSAVITREWMPGRGLRGSIGYATSGAGRLSRAADEYRYFSAALALNWAF